MAKKSTPSYDAFCKCFAGVFKKHALRNSTMHTCYVRSALDTYVHGDPERRAYLMEDAVREDLIGYRVARALLLQGWQEEVILLYSDEQQDRVERAEDFGTFADILRGLGYSDSSFHRDSNGARYAWLMDGAPCIYDRAELELGVEEEEEEEEEEDPEEEEDD